MLCNSVGLACCVSGLEWWQIQASAISSADLEQQLAVMKTELRNGQTAVDISAEAADRLRQISDERITKLEAELAEQHTSLTDQLQLLGQLYDKSVRVRIECWLSEL